MIQDAQAEVEQQKHEEDVEGVGSGLRAGGSQGRREAIECEAAENGGVGTAAGHPPRHQPEEQQRERRGEQRQQTQGVLPGADEGRHGLLQVQKADADGLLAAERLDEVVEGLSEQVQGKAGFVVAEGGIRGVAGEAQDQAERQQDRGGDQPETVRAGGWRAEGAGQDSVGRRSRHESNSGKAGRGSPTGMPRRPVRDGTLLPPRTEDYTPRRRMAARSTGLFGMGKSIRRSGTPAGREGTLAPRARPAPGRYGPLLAGLLLVLLTCLCHGPALRAFYIWDDDTWLTQNQAVKSPDGLARIWTDYRATPDPYPLVFTSFWAEYRIWKLWPVGFHAVNIAWHAGAAVLLWLLLRRLGLAGAWLIAAIWAIHPVQVETVAWVAERKNVMSAFFLFASLLAYVRFAGLGNAAAEASGAGAETMARGHGGWQAYGWALLFFVCSLLSKSATAPMPVVVLLLIWWKRGASAGARRRCWRRSSRRGLRRDWPRRTWSRCAWGLSGRSLTLPRCNGC